MKERGILFSAPMIRAVLDGRKTQTRRIVDAGNSDSELVSMGRHMFDPRITHHREQMLERCPYGVAGDSRLWVRETWAAADTMYGDEKDCPQTIAYYADQSAVTFDGDLKPHPVPAHDLRSWNWDSLKKRPSIYMPRWASRITLEITDVRVQRLQDITEEDAKAEGVPSVSEYAVLWDQINLIRCPWSADPWVWRIVFCVVPRS